MDTGQRKEPGLDRSYEKQIAQTGESSRLMFDLLKHISTLSAGSVLAVPVVLRTVFPDPRWAWLVVVALICLLVAVASSVVSAMFATTLRTPPVVMESDADRKQRLWNRYAYYRLFVAALLCFVLGILFFAAFAIVNLF